MCWIYSQPQKTRPHEVPMPIHRGPFLELPHVIIRTDFFLMQDFSVTDRQGQNKKAVVLKYDTSMLLDEELFSIGQRVEFRSGD